MYRWSGSALESRTTGEEASTRELSAFLCLGQPLGGDSAYTVFESPDLDEVLGVLGPPGYRAAHVEAGIANGRLLLCAHALAQGPPASRSSTKRSAAGSRPRPAACSSPPSVLLLTDPGPAAGPATQSSSPGYEALWTRLQAGLCR